ncbi:hypothetical protein GIB67_036361 [Kingdonia uniflora]|uniref:Protein kinase domain-containing protein n=1 Tax=Kingdonia uniflora TaxID=39325 RepID=A0A7J7L442_9MAGN|nr:hypothetical protein GIB67_036361 [Kingdonia uniflora]
MFTSTFIKPIMFPFFAIIIITFIFKAGTCFSTDHQQFTSCGVPFECGDIKASYPFWGFQRPVFCGHPGFELSCQYGSITSIQIMLDKYHVLAINEETQTLNLTRDDLLDGVCPQTSTNSTLDFALFEYLPTDQNITLFYGCSNLSIQVPSTSNFRCQSNGVVSDVYMVGFGPVPMVPELGVCNITVMIPVLQKAFQQLLNSVNVSNNSNSGGITLGTVLSQGFEVDWILDSTVCTDCIKSRGHCGYNTTLNQPVCYCRDKPYRTRCPATGKKSTLGRSLGIGFSATAGLVLIACIFFLVKGRKRKHLSFTSIIFCKGTSCNSTSKTGQEKGNMLFGAHIFTYNELNEATHHFDSTKELGGGGFGTVYYGKLRDKREVAVKRLFENNSKRLEQFSNEVEILTGLRHQNLVTLYGCTSRHSRELLLVYEFISNGTVADHLHGARANEGLLTWPIRMNIAIESADALAYLHASCIIHRDVKTNNILLDDNFNVKVADFGLSRLFSINVSHVSTGPQGTPGYVDPEYYQCFQLTDKSDVYSFGVVLMELISSKPAVDMDRHRYEVNLANMAVIKIRDNTLHELVDPSLGFETDCSARRMIILVSELAFRCLQQEKDTRPSMMEVLEVLRGIKCEGSKVGNAEEIDVPSEDILQLSISTSLESRTERNFSFSTTSLESTTPNTSFNSLSPLKSFGHEMS